MSTRLPILGSTATSTTFASRELRLDGTDSVLYLDGNAKITAGNGTFTDPQPNAFSLRDRDDCPGKTPTCSEACYVTSLAAAQPQLHALYRHNSAEIRRVLADPSLTDRWVMHLSEVIAFGCAGGFRWHVSGDVYSEAYAQFVADVCREAPTVDFWIYTRSFDYLGPLAEVSTLRGGNLALNLSCDIDNFAEAVEASVAYGVAPGKPLRLCYLTTDGKLPSTHLEAGDVIFPDYQLRSRQFATLAESPWWQSLMPQQRSLVCVVDAFGKSDKRRCGPCDRCLA